MHVVGISGSLQAKSTTAAVLAAIGELVVTSELAAGPPTFERANGLAELPHFNPDLDVEPLPSTVAAWRATLGAADAVVIATPEYAHSFPGALKDALDWIVGSGDLYEKPILLVTASGSGGVLAGKGLLPFLEVLTSKVVGPVSIWGVTPKVTDGHFADTTDVAALRLAVDDLLALVESTA